MTRCSFITLSTQCPERATEGAYCDEHRPPIPTSEQFNWWAAGNKGAPPSTPAPPNQG